MLFDRRMVVVGPAGAALAVVGALLCAVVSIGALLPVPAPVPLPSGSTVEVPERLGPHPGAALYVEQGTSPDVVDEVVAACPGARGEELRTSVIPGPDRELADGTVVEAVATDPDLTGGSTVRCGAPSTAVWVGVDESDLLTVGVLAGLFVPFCLVAALVLLLVGRASARRHR